MTINIIINNNLIEVGSGYDSAAYNEASLEVKLNQLN
jgi:hypothetical protein